MALDVELRIELVFSFGRMRRYNSFLLPFLQRRDRQAYESDFRRCIVELLGDLLLSVLEVTQIHDQNFPRDLAIAKALGSCNCCHFVLCVLVSEICIEVERDEGSYHTC